MRLKQFVVILFVIQGPILRARESWDEILKVEMYRLFELSIKGEIQYNDPFRDVELQVELISPEGRKLNHFGFYDGDNNWKVRFSPDERGKWRYKAWFSDGAKQVKGTFECTATDKPGRVTKNEFNPFWLGKGGSPKNLFRSFHVGDCFFAENWDNPNNPDDGNMRTQFLDWLQDNKYNMLSIASHYTNRDENSRGRFWETPKVWPLNPEEYRKMEKILDDLLERDITVFPFAGFFGARGNWPTDKEDQELYVKYILARIGCYPNIILNVAGPEPFWREDRDQYHGAMRMVDIQHLGMLIDSLDVHDHIITVHNEKRATLHGDPFIDEPWCDMSTLQGPTTIDRKRLYSGLAMNHHRYKPVYAQETLWAGNKYHPGYTDEQLRKNVMTILFSGSILNFADMNGNSSSGFSGTLKLEERNQHKHDLVHTIWDWFESIPFHQMKSRQDLVEQGFCLANEGVEYYVYLDTLGKVEVFLDFPYMLQSEWINAQKISDIRKGEKVNQKTVFETPADGDDWILHLYAPKPGKVATGNFPDLAVDKEGNIHLVYNRNGLMYKKYNQKSKSWQEEQQVGCACSNVERSDPDVVVDSDGNPHVFCGNEYAYYDGKSWKKNTTKGSRDTELAINGNDELYLVSRGENKGGYIRLNRRMKSSPGQWESLTAPDRLHKGKNDHVYPDLFIGQNNVIHLVQRHGPDVEVTYRQSLDGGKSWPIEEAVSDERSEAPHIVVNGKGKVFISTGKAYVFEREAAGKWQSCGRKLKVEGRMQPEFGIDQQNNIYLTGFGGRYNICYKDVWMGEKMIDPLFDNTTIGFVEPAGYKHYAYIVWEEGHGNPDEGMSEESSICVGILFPDGRIVGLF